MTDLTIKQIKEKIKQVEKDLDDLRLTGESGRKLEVLSEYKSYLEDEVRFLENEARSSKT